MEVRKFFQPEVARTNSMSDTTDSPSEWPLTVSFPLTKPVTVAAG